MSLTQLVENDKNESHELSIMYVGVEVRTPDISLIHI